MFKKKRERSVLGARAQNERRKISRAEQKECHQTWTRQLRQSRRLLAGGLQKLQLG
jgi:hypothetical protein